jgi:hypothetical protein
MQRLGIAAEQWLSLSCEFEQHFSGAVGKERLLRQYHQQLYETPIIMAKYSPLLYA